MVINEQVRGVLRYSVGENHEPRTLEFDESHIVKNSCSISAACCDSGKFAIGEARPSKLTIKLHIPSDEITRYSLFGSSFDIKIKYNDGDWIYMGRFYTTSAAGGRDSVYSITAYDALILFSPSSYDAQTYGDDSQATIDGDSQLVLVLKDHITSLTARMDQLLESLNGILRAIGTDEVEFAPYVDTTNNIFPARDNPDSILHWVLYANGKSFQRTSYLDFVRNIAEISAGCVQMMPDVDGSDNPKLYIVPYGYVWQNHPEMEWLEIPYDVQEKNSTEIADFEIYIQNVYTKTYDGTGWAAFSTYRQHNGNVVVDISGNPFVDGMHYHNTAALLPFPVLVNIKNQLGKSHPRPFSTKAHLSPQNRGSVPYLGQKTRIYKKDGTYAESIITAWGWTLHGGWKLSCGGEDSRTLSQGIVKSRAYHAETAAMTYTDAKTANASGAADDAKKAAEEAKTDAANAWGYADSAMGQANSAMSQADANFYAIDDLARRVSALEGR